MNWISVEDEYPEPIHNEYVLGWDGSEIRFLPSVSFMHCKSVTHWMPLPAPPTGELK